MASEHATSGASSQLSKLEDPWSQRSDSGWVNVLKWCENHHLVSCQWGYHPGGWGKPPVDEFNRPLYGDVFGLYSQYQQQLQSSIEAAHLTNPPVLEPWGELEVVEQEEEEEEEEQAEEMVEATASAGMATPMTAGFATPSGLSSVATGLATPDAIQLRKEPRSSEDISNKSLYTVIPEKQSKISGMMGSEHVYDVSGGSKRKFGENAVDISLNPEEIEDSRAVQSKYKAAIDGTQSSRPKEDLSEMVAEHSVKQDAKKRKLDERKEKKKEFKF
jgi:splicing factor 3B subunit 2